LEEFDDLKQAVSDDQAHANGDEMESHWNLVMVREGWMSRPMAMRRPITMVAIWMKKSRQAWTG
jgi:hypothetical protein